MPGGIRPSPEPSDPAPFDESDYFVGKIDAPDPTDRVGQLQWLVRRGEAARAELRRMGVRA